MIEAEAAGPAGGDGAKRALELLSDVLAVGSLPVDMRIKFATDLAGTDSEVSDEVLASWFQDALPH